MAEAESQEPIFPTQESIERTERVARMLDEVIRVAATELTQEERERLASYLALASDSITKPDAMERIRQSYNGVQQ